MANLLLLGRDRERLTGLRGILRKDGHRVTQLRTVESWRMIERDMVPDLVVAAVDSPEAVLNVAGRPARGFPAPILFVEQENDFCRETFLERRLVDRISSPFLGEELLARVDALVRVRRVIRGGSVDPDASSEAGEKRGGGLGAFGRRLSELLRTRFPRVDRPLAPYLEVATRVAEWADRRDAFEPGHAERVTSLCAMMAEGLGLRDDETSALLRAAMLHDIGKVAMPVEVLHQKEPLEEGQIRLIRTHPRRGAALLAALDRDDDVAATVLYHHERPDGRGYYATEWDRVPRTARILAVSEVYDAMTSSRIKEPVSSQVALERLEQEKGSSMDADCVDALVERMRPRSNTIPLSSQPRYA